MDWIVHNSIAHRGLHNGLIIPENSILAFEAAMEQNYPIELDVHLLADGGLAVFHDQDLRRMTSVEGTISQQTSITVKNLRLQDTDQQIPLFEEVLDLVNGKVPILIELKNPGPVGELEQNLLKQLTSYSGEYAVQSFNPMSMLWFKQKAPDIIRGQLSSDFKSGDLAWYRKVLLQNLLMNFASSPHFIAYDFRCLPYLPVTIVKKAQNIPLISWTIRSEADRLRALKVSDNIIFEKIRP
jgi:glycerophosphoryl diester phosphodiesterase